MSDEDRKDMLRSMVDNMVDNNDEQTQVDFHQYATSKLQSMLGYEPVNADEEVGSEDEVEVEVEDLDADFESSEEVGLED